MDDFRKLTRHVTFYLFGIGCVVVAITLLLVWVVVYSGVDFTISLPVVAVLLLSVIYLTSRAAANYVLKPFRFLWQAILHVAPNSNVSPPNLDKLKVGHQLVTKLAHQVYQFASQQDGTDLIDHRKALIQASAVVSHLPLPLFVFNKELLVTQASDKALEYCQIESSELFGKPLFHNLNLEFPSSTRTLESWINECQKNKVTDQSYWERVRVIMPDGKSRRQCDLAADYNRDSPSGTEFLVTIFDRTKRYKQDDDSMGLVALAVHELRTPLTMLRGYIEVFEDEMSDKLDDELKDFMYKMEVSAQQLTAFVSNILNVARVDEGQLTLRLLEENWDKVLRAACLDAELKAKVHGKTIEYNIAPNIPSVAVDRLSIYEVLNNLLDNAIKYGGETEKIIVTSVVGKDGMIETEIKDFGAGISPSVIPNLFEKFYRNHRTRAQVGGTGLGLYLSKAIVSAHSGQIWVNSKEGEGSTFGFSLQPYDKLAEELKKGNNEITRSAHGWIKNHSIYRR